MTISLAFGSDIDKLALPEDNFSALQRLRIEALSVKPLDRKYFPHRSIHNLFRIVGGSCKQSPCLPSPTFL